MRAAASCPGVGVDTPARAACFATCGGIVAVFFLDRDRDEVAHDGHLASDEAEQPDHTA